ncbi:MAG: DUF4445 domain-containing protein [Deltaproteobacteria bacterium]|nr:DUF4445 domain-containing protein [Deltaproteobacteria bacterium]
MTPKEEIKINDPLGVAFDIGTTTLVGALTNLKTKERLRTISEPNPQQRWGKDLLSRVKAITDNPLLLKELQGVVIKTCDLMLGRLLPKGKRVEKIIIAGNTVMEHIFFCVSPEGLGKIPYRPAFKESKKIKATELGFDPAYVTEKADLYSLPIIGGFVGGDTIGVILALELHKNREAPRLAIDIGTNSEIVLSTKDKLFTASAAAGPAFEGGEMMYGMSAKDGAIEGLEVVDGLIKLQVIGNATPDGICGSGLIKATSEFIRAGVIAENGQIQGSKDIDSNLSNRVKEGEDGRYITLYRGGASSQQRKSTHPEEITLSQADVRALQVAKGAIRAGISILLDKAKVKIDELEKIYIAGAFGANLNTSALKTIGLLEDEWLSKVESTGDAALQGTLLAFDKDTWQEGEEVARSTKYVSLSGSKHFEREFMSNMNFKK